VNRARRDDVAALVDSAPPLTAEQRAALRALLSTHTHSEAGSTTDPAIARIPIKDTTCDHRTGNRAA
jgi:hypothetical protein